MTDLCLLPNRRRSHFMVVVSVAAAAFGLGTLVWGEGRRADIGGTIVLGVFAVIAVGLLVRLRKGSADYTAGGTGVRCDILGSRVFVPWGEVRSVDVETAHRARRVVVAGEAGVVRIPTFLYDWEPDALRDELTARWRAATSGSS